jgi:hypothetical protein
MPDLTDVTPPSPPMVVIAGDDRTAPVKVVRD